jgi:hypothetical protein
VARRDDEKRKQDAAQQQGYVAAAITAAGLTEIARRLAELLNMEELFS